MKHHLPLWLLMLCNLQVSKSRLCKGSKRVKAENAEATGAPRRPRFPT